jgi:hypothetical protein
MSQVRQILHRKKCRHDLEFRLRNEGNKNRVNNFGNYILLLQKTIPQQQQQQQQQ